MSTPRSQSFGKSLFFGDLREELIFPFPRLGRDEEEPVRERLAAFARFAEGAIDPQRLDETAHLPPELLAGLRGLGLFGLSVPRRFGGLGHKVAASCRLIDAVAARDGAVAATLSAHDALCTTALTLFGSEAQQQRYLPGLASGACIGSFCVTEPLAGSDANSIRTRAREIPASQGGGFVLDGTKLWVLNGGLADLFVVFAQTEVRRDGLPVDRVTAFLVERGPGVRTGAEERKLGVRAASTPALYLENVRVGPEHVLGPIGGGHKVAMETVNRGRLGFAAACLGPLRELLRLSVQHATCRRQFGRLLSTLGMIKEKIASTAIDLYAAESVVYLTAGMVDHAQLDFSLESACAKVLASEALWRAAHETMNLIGGAGFLDTYPFQRLLRDARMPLLFPGTSEVLRCYIALTGLAAPGEHMDKLSDAIKFPLRGYGLVVESLVEKVRVAAYGRAQLTRHHPRLKKEAVAIEDVAETLAREVDRVLRRYGRQIHEMQYVQSRLADVVIDLYAMCAVVARASAALTERDARHARGALGLSEAAGEIDAAERELRLCIGFCTKASARVRERLAQFGQNDDELMKTIADDSYHGRAYPFDAVL